MRVLIEQIKLYYMQISKFIDWLWSIILSVGSKSKSRKLIPQETYDQLVSKVQELEKLVHEESLKTEKLKTNFLNNIYHEIRTPLNSIIGFSELLKHEDLANYKKNNYLSKIKTSSQEFLKIIDQLLDAAIVETGNVELKKTDCSLTDLLDEVHQQFTIQKHIQDKCNIALLKNYDKFYPDLRVRVDCARLQQIFTNLIGNAIKFTEKGIIEYGFKVLNDYKILFFVKDSGIGINLTNDIEVFEKFEKSEYCFGRENRGLGLGLCIAKGLVKMLNGTIWAESNSFGGTTFKFTIPFEKLLMNTTDKTTKTKSSLVKTLYLFIL